METLLRDLRYGLRMLLKRPGVTAAAVIALALGIGANGAIFSILNALLLRPLPYPEPQRIVSIDETAPRQGLEFMSVSYPNFADWRDRCQSFESVAAYAEKSFTLTDGDTPERIEGAAGSADLFSVLAVQPIIGRDFRPDEDKVDANNVVILSHGLWQRRFGADSNIIGQTLTLNGKGHTVIAVMPPRFKFPEVADLWVPLGIDANKEPRGNHYLAAVGRVKPGVTVQQARAEMEAIASQLEAEYPASNAGTGVSLLSLQDKLTQDSRPTVLVLFGAVIFVLLIACANVANLLLALGAAREKEISIRLALGAGRLRLIRQMLTESMLLGLLGGLLGIGLAVLGVKFILALIPVQIPFWIRFDVDHNVLGFTLLISLLTGVVFGLAPALQATKANLNESLKEGGRGSTGGLRRNRMRSLLVVSELALAVVLLIGAGLMIKSVRGLQKLDPGFNARNLLTMELSLPAVKYPDPEKRTIFYRQLLSKVEAAAGVQSVAAVSNLPLGGSNWGKGFSVEGLPPTDAAATPVTSYRSISANYFQTMGTTVLKGREYTGEETKDGPRVVVINEKMAQTFWPDQDPLGKRIKFSRYEEDSPWHTVIGVVADAKQSDMNAPIRTEAYVPHVQQPVGFMTLVIRTASDPHALISAVQADVSGMDKDLPLYNIKSMEQVVAESFWDSRLSAILLGIFSVTALILASVGVYGVISYSVTMRTHEIGIRMALGAQPRDVLKLVVGHAVVLTTVSLVVGLIAALAATHLMSSLLYGVSATDPVIFVLVPAALAFVAVLASYIPARKAAKVDPMIALRYE